ncbi:ATP-binding protein [Actinoplanes sp. NPDC049118]|uniref:ATP-binding protein n=1 Tax=Actinoplanes sp. NPDC049118 TaxID=3155769 RepID=UPI0033E4FE0F
MRGSTASRTAWALWILAVASTAGAMALLVVTRSVPDDEGRKAWLSTLIQMPGSLVLPTVGLVLAARRPANPIGWLLLGIGLAWNSNECMHLYAVYALTYSPGSLPGGLVVGWVACWNWAIAFPLMPFVFLLFPHGRLPSRRWRPLAWAAGTSGVAILLLAPFRSGPLEYFQDIENPAGVSAIPPDLLRFAGLPYFLLLFTCTASLVVRLRRAHGDERQQLKWVTAAALLFGVELVVGPAFLPVPVHSVLDGLVVVVFAGAIAIAVLKYRLYDIDVLISRSVVYGTLTAAVVGVYLLVTGLGGAALNGSTPLPAVVAAAVVAIGLAPARDRLQRAVNRLLYGERDDPLRAVTHLGDSVAETGEPNLLAAVLASVKQAVHATGVAVLAPDGRELATIGVEVRNGESLPLRVGGNHVGVLRVAARGPRDTYSDADRTLLTALAPSVAVVVRALDLTEALAVERDRVVAATAVERDRLRRDLHDGLGPSLSGVGLGLQALDDATRIHDTTRSLHLLERLRAEVSTAVGEVRRILDELRPATLDDLGLVAAVRRHAATVAASLPVDVTAAALPVLSPQVETAAYRIAQEALTNAARHAQAHHARIDLAPADHTLIVTITDDGVGLGAAPAGLGLASMRDRAESVGGHFRIDTGPGGTTVTAALPLELS